MEKISIKTSGVNIFSPAVRRHESKHTNPFGISFKGNVIQADVFSSSKTSSAKNENVFDKVVNKSRAFKSAIVGGINNFNTKLNTRFNNGINRIISFGKKIGNDTKELIRKANSTYVIFDVNNLSAKVKHLTAFGTKTNEMYTVENLVKHPVSELEVMLNKELETRKG